MKKILLIDDEIKLRETLAEMFSFIGYQVIEAHDGMEGLEKVSEYQPDIILCDVMMPKLDGYGFLKNHLLTDNSSIPVVLLTAKTEVKKELLVKNKGAVAYIKKPFSFIELKKVIEANIKNV